MFLGGGAMPLTDEALVDAARTDLHNIMGLEAEPVFHNVARWPHSMAQYTVGHAKRVDRIEELVNRMPGLYLAGNAYHGIGIPDCVRMGQEAATKISAGYKPELQPRNLDPIHVVRQIEGRIDFSIGIKRQQEILNQKIERSAGHRQAADFYTKQMHRRLAMSGLDAGLNLHKLFPLDQFGDQPTGLYSTGAPHLQEIDPSRGSCFAVSQHKVGSAKSIRDDGRRLGSHPCVQLRRREVNHRAGPGLAALDEIQFSGDTRRQRVGASKQCRGSQQRDQNPRAQIRSQLRTQVRTQVP